MSEKTESENILLEIKAELLEEIEHIKAELEDRESLLGRVNRALEELS